MKYLYLAFCLLSALMAESVSPVGHIVEERIKYSSSSMDQFNLTYYRADGQAARFWEEYSDGGLVHQLRSYSPVPYMFRFTEKNIAELTGYGTTKLFYKGDYTGNADSAENYYHTFTIWPSPNKDGFINCSNRCQLAPGSIATSGFVLQCERYVLIRVVGPSLQLFGVQTAASDCSFRLYCGDGWIAASSHWGADERLVNGYRAIFDYVGAFPLTDNSNDSVRFIRLPAGVYTVQASAGTQGGEVLTEIYIMH